LKIIFQGLNALVSALFLGWNEIVPVGVQVDNAFVYCSFIVHSAIHEFHKAISTTFVPSHAHASLIIFNAVVVALFQRLVVHVILGATFITKVVPVPV